MRNILIVQLIIVPLLALAMMAWGQPQALAALFGGATALINSLLAVRRISKVNKKLDPDPGSDVRSMYAGAVERFAITLGAMGLGMGWLKLDPPALLLGFAVAYLAFPLAKYLPPAEQNSAGK